MKVLTAHNFRGRTTEEQREKVREWVEKNGYRFTITYMIAETDDPNYLTIHCYALNEKGNRFVDPRTREAVLEDGVLVPSAGFPAEIWDKL